MKKKISYDDLISMGKEYGVNENALFVAAARQYEIESSVIELMQFEITGCPLMTENGTSPLVKELPKHMDIANKTLAQMCSIIEKLGREKQSESKLSAFLKE